MSIECIQHIENSYVIKQKLAIDQQAHGNNDNAIHYYLEALSRLELLCSSYKAHIKIGFNLYIQYIETNINLAQLYKKENYIDKYQKSINKIVISINKLEGALGDNSELMLRLNSYKEKLIV